MAAIKPTLRKGEKVNVRATRSDKIRAGEFVKTHSTLKGDYYEIKPADGAANFKARPCQVSAA